ncbi:hypothetical protein STEG23_014433 [Scotinomys teguina]
MLDPKDAFFSLPLVPASQHLFAFKWSDMNNGLNGQLTWTGLPQGFKNSPLSSMEPSTRIWFHNSPYTLNLIPFEIMYVKPQPLLPNLKVELLAEFDDRRFLSSLQVLFRVQKQL